MDESFLLRARRMLEERRTTIDHRSLVLQISERQSASPTARAAALAHEDGASAHAEEGLIAILLVDGDLRSATRRQGGCFNRAAAKRHLNSV